MSTTKKRAPAAAGPTGAKMGRVVKGRVSRATSEPEPMSAAEADFAAYLEAIAAEVEAEEDAADAPGELPEPEAEARGARRGEVGVRADARGAAGPKPRRARDGGPGRGSRS